MLAKTKSVLSSMTMQGLAVVLLGVVASMFDVDFGEGAELLGIVYAAIGRLRASQGLHIVKPWCVVLICLCATGSASAQGQALAEPVAHPLRCQCHGQQCQPIRGVLRGLTPHVLIVGVDGVRDEIRGMRDEGGGRSHQTASLWTWSASGQAHHAAVVRVSNPVDGSAGSGVYCSSGGLVGVMTCAHLEPRDKLRVTFADGTVLDGAATIDKFKHDICFVSVTHPTITPAPIATQDVRPGEQVEFATYGGPDARFRHFLGNVSVVGNLLEVATPVTHGDSGAPVFNSRGELIGIQSVGMGATLTNSRGFNVYARGGAVGWGPLTQFAGRCGGGQCAPQSPGFQSPAGGSGGGVDFYPPPQIPPSQPSPAPGPQPVPNPPAAVAVDYDRLSAIVLSQLDQDIRDGKYSDQLRGPAGATGPPASIDVDELARRLPPVVLSIDGAQQSAPLGQPIKLRNQQRKVR